MNTISRKTLEKSIKRILLHQALTSTHCCLRALSSGVIPPSARRCLSKGIGSMFTFITPFLNCRRDTPTQKIIEISEIRWKRRKNCGKETPIEHGNTTQLDVANALVIGTVLGGVKAIARRSEETHLAASLRPLRPSWKGIPRPETKNTLFLSAQLRIMRKAI